nr:MAG TPA: hypothetical protein [Caudoviricetes sp.]
MQRGFAEVLQRKLKTISCGEHKHPRIQSYRVFYGSNTRFVLSRGIDIHVPHW